MNAHAGKFYASSTVVVSGMAVGATYVPVNLGGGYAGDDSLDPDTEGYIGVVKHDAPADSDPVPQGTSLTDAEEGDKIIAYLRVDTWGDFRVARLTVGSQSDTFALRTTSDAPPPPSPPSPPPSPPPEPAAAPEPPAAAPAVSAAASAAEPAAAPEPAAAAAASPRHRPCRDGGRVT